ncbi:MAG TPA: type II CAAX endopeptidase family protein [Rhizomicrobium sp.]|jgi:hypothetical protein
MTIDTGVRPVSRGGRFLRHWFVRFVIFFGSILALYIASGAVPRSIFGEHAGRNHPWALLVSVAVAIPVMLLVYRGLVHWLERRRVSELALPGAPAQLAIGAGIGFVLLSLVIGGLVMAGFGTIAIPAVLAFPTGALALSLVSGVAEELLLRGAMFRIVEERFGTLVALLASAAFFGALHIANPGATVTSSTAIALEAGLLLALAYSATRRLWLPIGLHFGWNFTEGGIFSTAVSGGRVPGLLVTKLNGPEILTGGAFGPEASVVTVGVCLIAAAIFLVLTLRRDQWKPFVPRRQIPFEDAAA